MRIMAWVRLVGMEEASLSFLLQRSQEEGAGWWPPDFFLLTRRAAILRKQKGMEQGVVVRGE